MNVRFEVLKNETSSLPQEEFSKNRFIDSFGVAKKERSRKKKKGKKEKERKRNPNLTCIMYVSIPIPCVLHRRTDALLICVSTYCI
jgi:hypothetical protein